MVKIVIVIHSLWGHIAKLAETIKEGALQVPDVEVEIVQVPETLDQATLEQMKAQKFDYRVIDPLELPNYDGIMLGLATRYGRMNSQMAAFFDRTGPLFSAGKLVGKPFSMFVSTGTLGGGQEATIMNTLSQIVHHGGIFVPIGYSAGAVQYDVTTVHGGSAWGAGTIVGDGSRQPNDIELQIARHQGQYFAKFVKALVKGREITANENVDQSKAN